MSPIKLLQVNIRSLNTSKRYLEQYVDKHNINLVFLSETWNDKSYLSFKNWKCNNLFKNRPESTYGGVAILPSCGTKIVRRFDLEDNDLELVWAEAEIDKTKVLIATIYIPPSRTDLLLKFEENLFNVLNKTENPIIITGDFNSRSYMWGKWHTSHEKRYERAWKQGQIIEEWLVRYDLTLLNNGQPTRVSGDQRSAIDLTFTARFDQNKIKWTLDTCNPLWTDHIPIIILIEGDTNDSISHTAWNFKKTNWTHWKEIINTEMTKWMNQFRDLDIPSGTACELFTARLLDLAKQYIPSKKISNHSKPFWSSKLSTLLHECKMAK